MAKKAKRTQQTYKVLALTLCAVMTLASAAHARDTEPLKAHYQTRSGFSSWTLTDVSFLTGYELNALTNSINAYDLASTYGVVFFAQGQVAVIEIDGITNCLATTTKRCVWGVNSPAFSTLSGRDQSGRQWEFCDPSNPLC